jgi:nicotinate dehydrogenase subunit A
MANITELRINGKIFRLDAEPERSLLSVLREDLDLTGTKYGCGEGECGACTVLADGAPIRSCNTTVGAVAAKPITTIEGLEQHGRLHPVQQAFLETSAFQCGYCTPGMIMTVVGLLKQRTNWTADEILSRLDGHLCRCCGYPSIVKAVWLAAAQPRR